VVGGKVVKHRRHGRGHRVRPLQRLRACWQGNHQHTRIFLLVILTNYSCATQALTDIALVLLTEDPIGDV